MDNSNNQVELQHDISPSPKNITSDKKLWDPKFFTFFCVLGSFLFGAVLFSINYGRLGFKKKQYIILFSAIIVMIVLALLEPPRILFTAFNCLLGVLMTKIQSKLFVQHLANGGKKASYKVPVIIVSIIIVFFILLVFFG